MKRKQLIGYGLLAGIVLLVGYLLVWLPQTVEPEETAPPQVDWEQVVDDPDEHLTIRMVRLGTPPEVRETGIELIGKRFNVTFETEYIHNAAWNRKKGLILAGGKIPDLYMDASTGLQASIRQGFLLPVPLEVIARHAPSHMRMVQKYAPYAWHVAKEDGINYGIPTVWLSALYPRTPLWRKDWLEKVGIPEIPKTLEEMETALFRFRHNDPDGNGVMDTWGMSGDMQFHYTSFNEIFGAFGILPYDFYLQEGEFVYGGIQPEVQSVLALLARWYKNGLIHPDFITDRWFSEVRDKLFAGRIGYVNYFSSYETFNRSNPNSAVNLMEQLQPDSELAPGPPPAGPDGQQGMRIWGTSGSTLVFGRPMAEDPRKVIRVLKIIEALATDEQLFMTTAIGTEAIHWEWTDSRRFGTRQLPPYNEPNRLQGEALVPVLFTDGFHPVLPVSLQREKGLPYLLDGVVGFRERYRKIEWARTNVVGQSDILPEAASLYGNLVGYQAQYYQRVIRGLASPDSFPEFLKGWQARGGDQFLEMVETYYREQEETAAKVEALLAE